MVLKLIQTKEQQTAAFQKVQLSEEAATTNATNICQQSTHWTLSEWQWQSISLRTWHHCLLDTNSRSYHSSNQQFLRLSHTCLSKSLHPPFQFDNKNLSPIWHTHNSIHSMLTEITAIPNPEITSHFFSTWVFVDEHSQLIGQQGKSEAISLTPPYYFHLLQRHYTLARHLLNKAHLRTKLANKLKPGTFGFWAKSLT